MSERAIDSMMNTTLEKIRQMVDVSTVVGDPITLPDGATVVPISKVAYGFASGGSDLPSKHPSAKGYFAGGAGAGVTVTPVAFIVSQNGQVRVQQVEPYTSSMDRAISTMPEIVDKISNLVVTVSDKFGGKTEDSAELAENK
ncbi:MAG: GerW family sporulation protein [Clostridia bacterium]|nr:GerW family sporulation protein [Clostridia bacterium]